MAHNTIYQITTTPVPPEEHITESDFCEHRFVGSIADYVRDEVDRYAEIRRLGDLLKNLRAAAMGIDSLGNYSFTLRPHGKEAYFARAYETFTSAREKTEKLSLAEFSSGDELSSLMWRMTSAYEDKFGAYVSSDEFGTITFDEFIRQATAGMPYYIGGVLDYHY